MKYYHLILATPLGIVTAAPVLSTPNPTDLTTLAVDTSNAYESPSYYTLYQNPPLTHYGSSSLGNCGFVRTEQATTAASTSYHNDSPFHLTTLPSAPLPDSLSSPHFYSSQFNEKAQTHENTERDPWRSSDPKYDWLSDPAWDWVTDQEYSRRLQFQQYQPDTTSQPAFVAGDLSSDISLHYNRPLAESSTMRKDGGVFRQQRHAELRHHPLGFASTDQSYESSSQPVGSNTHQKKTPRKRRRFVHRHRCRVCNKTCADADDFKKHRAQCRQKNFICDKCGEPFARKDNMRKHKVSSRCPINQKRRGLGDFKLKPADKSRPLALQDTPQLDDGARNLATRSSDGVKIWNHSFAKT